MLRLLLTVFLVIVASVLYEHFRELNPNSITLRFSSSTTHDLSLASLVLLSMAAGAALVTMIVGIRETAHAIVNWRSGRLRRREEKVTTLHREGTHAFLSKRTNEAIGLFQKALAQDPNHVDSLLWLGNIYRTEKNYTEAIRLHRKARSIEDGNIEVLLALAKDLEGAKRFEEALQVLRDILKLDSANLTALIGKRDLHIRLEGWNEALDIQHRLMKAHLSEADQQREGGVLVGLTYEVGRHLLERGQPDKARHYFRATIKRNKQFLPAYIGLGEILIHEGKTKSAAEILEKVYGKTANVILLHRLEELYLDMGEPGEIIRIYQQASQRDPRNPVLKFYLGKLYYRLEMVDEAYDLLSSLEGPPDQMADYHKIMANLYLRKQHMDLAVEELKKALGFKKRVVVPYHCTHCQHESAEWSGRCGRCGTWNTFVALPWVDATSTAAHADAGTPEARAVAYHGFGSPYETV
ncbi:MAG TPA: tetratricopeptide repeat protein [Nitrospiraceae bacterium]|jgi:lipopolysaccharide biosynthesis regulator YciM